MNKKNFDTVDTALLGDAAYGIARYSVGRTLLRKLATEAGAVRKLGKSWRFRIDILDAYIEAQNSDR